MFFWNPNFWTYEYLSGPINVFKLLRTQVRMYRNWPGSTCLLELCGRSISSTWGGAQHTTFKNKLRIWVKHNHFCFLLMALFWDDVSAALSCWMTHPLWVIRLSFVAGIRSGGWYWNSETKAPSRSVTCAQSSRHSCSVAMLSLFLIFYLDWNYVFGVLPL